MTLIASFPNPCSVLGTICVPDTGLDETGEGLGLFLFVSLDKFRNNIKRVLIRVQREGYIICTSLLDNKFLIVICGNLIALEVTVGIYTEGMCSCIEVDILFRERIDVRLGSSNHVVGFVGEIPFRTKQVFASCKGVNGFGLFATLAVVRIGNTYVDSKSCLVNNKVEGVSTIHVSIQTGVYSIAKIRSKVPTGAIVAGHSTCVGEMVFVFTNGHYNLIFIGTRAEMVHRESSSCCVLVESALVQTFPVVPTTLQVNMEFGSFFFLFFFLATPETFIPIGDNKRTAVLCFRSAIRTGAVPNPSKVLRNVIPFP